jgi:cell division septation protein DedD
MDMEPDPKPFPAGQQGRPVYGMPDPPRPRRSRLFLVGVPVLAVFTGFAAIVWMAYEGGAGSPAGEPPLIRAATSPIKLSPDQARGSDVAEEEGVVRELLSDIPFDQQLERLLPDLEEPLTPPAPVERAEPSPQPVPAPGQMAAVDLPPPDRADRPAEPPAAELATPPPQPAGSPEPAPASPETSEPAPASTSSQPAPPTAAQAPRPAPSRPTPTPASPEPGPTADAALDALIAEVTQTPAPRPDRRTEAALSRSETATPAAPREPTPAPTARPREQQMTATTPSGPRDGTPTGRETREPAITAAPSQSQTASGSGYRVQLAAVREQADARRAWDLFMLDLGPILSRYQPYFERADTANGIFYRVQVGPFASAEAAETTCDELKQRNASCFVVRR